MKALLATVAIALLALGACGGDDGGDQPEDGAPTATAGGTADAGDLSSYEDIASLNDALTSAGIECVLEYEGLRDENTEQSLCTIDGGQARLTVYFDEALLQAFVAPDGGEPPAAVAYGANWTVELASPESAQAVAEAAGGTTTDA